MNAEETPSVLLVDDEPGILSALRRLLRPLAFKVFTAEGGAAGLAILEQERIDVVISDMRMPEMDGARFLATVRERWPDVIRILLTGYADITSTIAAINEGQIYRYITKPWNDHDIVMLVREAVDRVRLQAENRRLTALTQRQNAELRELNTGLEQKVAERTAALQTAMESLKKTFIGTVNVCSGLVELRAGEVRSQLAGHGRRVADHAKNIARRLDLGEPEVQDIVVAGLLHDIGKIGLPDELLTLPFVALGPEQRAAVMRHPVTGQNLLMPIEKLRDCGTLIRHHHENFDGSGFPDHLSGLAIPFGARILAVANDFDALQIGTLTQRPLSPADALTFLIANRGKRYDPAVVDCLATLRAESNTRQQGEIPLPPQRLQPGMVLARDLVHPDGYLLLVQGSALTKEIIAQLMRMEDAEQRRFSLFIRQEKQ